MMHVEVSPFAMTIHQPVTPEQGNPEPTNRYPANQHLGCGDHNSVGSGEGVRCSGTSTVV